MKRTSGLLALAGALALAPPAVADSITGDIALGGTNTYDATSLSFTSPGFVFHATGSLGVMTGFPVVTLSDITFATAPGELLFDWNHGGTDITMTLINLVVDHNGPTFLNTHGEATFTETGFSPTDYDFSLTSTTTGVTSFALTASPPAVIPEPPPRVLVLIGLVVGFIPMVYVGRCRKTSILDHKLQ
jgi:hypothetical protein